MSPLTDEKIQEILEIFPVSFTEIVIEDIIPKDLSFLKGSDFENRMRKVLPLKPDRKDQFLLSIDDNEKKILRNYFLIKIFFRP